VWRAINNRFSLVLITLTVAFEAQPAVKAWAQCAPTDKIFIDPRLVPQRQTVTKEQYIAVMSNPYSDPALKKYIMDSYNSQFQPMQLPYGRGMVMISPINPCVQQYIGP
jgi:hypothetical protein